MLQKNQQSQIFSIQNTLVTRKINFTGLDLKEIVNI